MKRRTLLISTILGVALLPGIFASLYTFEREPLVASAVEFPRNLPSPTPLPTAVAGISAQVLEKFADTEVMTQSNAGVEMSVANFRVERNKVNNFDEFRVDVCFQKPDNGDWGIREAVAQIGDKVLPADGGTTFEQINTLQNGQRQITTFLGEPPQLISKEVESNSLPDYRCDTLRFRLNAEISVPDVTLVVKSIVVTPHEGTGCETFFDNVQSILDAEGTGIRLDCVKQDYGEFMSIAEKPETMSEEEALRILNEVRYKLFVIEGPWVFTGSIK